MSHTWETKYTRFVSNSDLSGGVEIVDIQTGERITVLGDDLLSFVGSYVRDRKIAALEDLTPLEVLGLTSKTRR